MSGEDVFSIDELVVRYPHNWLALKVVERNPDSGQPVNAKLLAANADVYKIRANLGSGEYCVYYTGSIPEENYVAML